MAKVILFGNEVFVFGFWINHVSGALRGFWFFILVVGVFVAFFSVYFDNFENLGPISPWVGINTFPMVALVLCLMTFLAC